MPRDNPGRPQILVVDDAATYRSYLRQIVEALGATIEEAADGVAGIEQAIQGGFALAVIDVNMPGLNGYAVVEALRQEPQTRALPVIMFSSESKQGDRIAAYRAGANLYLVKPMQQGRLGHYLRLILGDRVS